MRERATEGGGVKALKPVIEGPGELFAVAARSACVNRERQPLGSTFVD
jgi:hypothetical protein